MNNAFMFQSHMCSRSDTNDISLYPFNSIGGELLVNYILKNRRHGGDVWLFRSTGRPRKRSR